jgi:CxxC motif-containing protein (DUF1111 family)
MKRLLAGVLTGMALAGCGSVADDSGAGLFRHAFTRSEGLGPLFNRDSCASCHAVPRIGGTGRRGLATAVRAGVLPPGGGDVRGSVTARARGGAPGCAPGIPPGANATSVRNAPALFGLGEIAAIPEAAIRANAASAPAAVRGRPNVVGGRLARLGWKADVVTLHGFVAGALRNELGVSSAAAPGRRCDGGRAELDVAAVRSLTRFVAALPAPDPAPVAPVFTRTGCAACHTPDLAGVPVYSDLVLHDMGRALDDRFAQGAAAGHDWRTAPLWGLGDRARFLHDGRARSLVAAISAHGGQAATAARRFRRLAPGPRRRLLAFLRSL